MTDHIKKYWDSQAKRYKSSHWASWGDNWAIQLEMETINSYINSSDEIIDIGCANGYGTFYQYSKTKPKSITGVDYSKSMIDEAMKVKNKHYKSDNIQFSLGDVRNLNFDDSTFDLAYTTRVLINIPTWEEQIIAIEECLRVLRKGGKLILSEGFWEPLCQLNAMRKICQLDPLVEHDFNRYLKKNKLIEFLETKKLSYTINNFSSVYYLGSRLLRELITDIDAYPGFTNPINEIFFNLERDFSGGDFGIQQIFAITK